MTEPELLRSLPVLAFQSVLLLSRLGAAAMIAPGLGEADVPVRIRLAVALALVPLLLPLLAGQLPPQPEDIPGTLRLVATELLVGLWIGGLARVVAMALSAAFQIVALAMGLASVLVPDAQMGSQTAILGRLGSLATAVLVLSTGLYAQPLRALAGSYEVLPPGAPWPAGAAAADMAGAGAAMLALALRLASPFLLGLFLVNLASGLLARVAPQLQVNILVSPAQILGGMVLLGLMARPLLDGFLAALAASWAGLPGL
ncbi:MAG: type III secretion protein [Azospirillum brasilense]|nr:MAG: type III secretion protein [Azospirillum brasilense]